MTVRLILGGATTVLLVGAAIAAAPANAATTSAPPASIRAAHLSPDTPGVDIYLTSAAGSTKLWMSDEKYGEVSPYVAVKPGIYTVAMRLHGASAKAPALMTWKLAAATGRAYTAAAVGTGAKRRGTVLFDNLIIPKAGTGRVRVIQAASEASRATVVAVHGPIVAQNTAFATSTGYAQVPAGTWPLKATVAGKPSLTAQSSVSVASASVTSILLLDAPKGGLTLKTVVDAAGARTAPTGAVPAGGGSTATTVIDAGHGVTEAELLAGLMLLLLLAGGWNVRTRLVAHRQS